MYRSPRWLLATALGGVLAIGAAAATDTASAATTSGTVHVWVTTSRGGVQPIVLTGFIADHGTATNIDKDGKVDQNGEYVKVKLTQGSFEVDAVAFNKSLGKARPTIDNTTCSAWLVGSGNVTIFDGSGAYAGISGTVKMTTDLAFIGARYKSGAKKGQCNLNGTPTASFQSSLTGVGKVTL